MSLFIFLTVLQGLVAAALVGVILMQRSEGGGLGVGGSPSGLMSARGAANFLTRATAVLAALFVVLSIILATVAVGATSGREIDTTLQRGTAPVSSDPLGAVNGPAPAAAPSAAPAAPAPADPLSGAAQK
ncbi:MAG: preprotein translocase subunit SecG [Novosphingobium sp.]